ALTELLIDAILFIQYMPDQIQVGRHLHAPLRDISRYSLRCEMRFYQIRKSITLLYNSADFKNNRAPRLRAVEARQTQMADLHFAAAALNEVGKRAANP